MVAMKTFSFPAESHVCELVFAWASGVHVSTGEPVGERRGVENAGGFGVRALHSGKQFEGRKGVQQRAELPLEVIYFSQQALGLFVESLGLC